MKGQRKRTRRKADAKRSIRSAKSRFVPPRTLEEFFAMPERDQEIWRNIGQAVTEMRAGTSRRQAARKFALDPSLIAQRASSALRKQPNGRWVAKRHDNLLRVLLRPTRKGLREIGVRDSRQASLLGQYWTAVERYRDTGDGSALRQFRGKHIIDATGKRVRLLTDRRALDHLGSAGVLSFETIYARAA
jgi:hypothetical protein